MMTQTLSPVAELALARLDAALARRGQDIQGGGLPVDGVAEILRRAIKVSPKYEIDHLAVLDAAEDAFDLHDPALLQEGALDVRLAEYVQANLPGLIHGLVPSVATVLVVDDPIHDRHGRIIYILMRQPSDLDRVWTAGVHVRRDSQRGPVMTFVDIRPKRSKMYPVHFAHFLGSSTNEMLSMDESFSVFLNSLQHLNAALWASAQAAASQPPPASAVMH